MTAAARPRRLPKPTLRSPGNDLGPRARRTIERILDATRTVLLARGYAGTTIDDITTTAGVSRASFYTYFPSKRDVLLALGADSVESTETMLARFAADHPGGSLTETRELVDAYFAHLERDGAFAIAWTQAAEEDEEIRVAGMHGHLRMCAGLARTIAGGDGTEDSAAGLAAYCLLERAWAFSRLYADHLDDDALRDQVAHMLHRALATR